MKQTILFILTLTTFFLTGCNNNPVKTANDKPEEACCADHCQAKNSSTDLVCKLTSDEMQKRKETVIASLRKQVLEKKELANGYAFKFNGSNEMFDELTEFIKTERECCEFFTFNLSVAGDKNEIWLEVTGPEGVKDFMTELPK